MKKKWWKSDWFPVAITAVLAGLLFVHIYGIHVLNPTYDAWLLNSADGDLTQHYIGWRFFRNADWGFPIGMIHNLAYPNASSVIFTDSIPLFAAFFKLFRGILPQSFQYFGIYGLLCFVLQGVFGALICQKYVKTAWSTVLGGMLFVLAPVMIDRMFWMTSLSSHYLILFGIWILASYNERFSKELDASLAFLILGILCGGIHLYFLPMCGLFAVGYAIVSWMDKSKQLKKDWWKALLPGISFVAGAGLTIYLFGGFSGGMNAANDGLGYYSFNLNGFTNPHGWSSLLRDKAYNDSQYEGFAYLGAGILLLLVITVAIIVGVSIYKKKCQLVWTSAQTAYAVIAVLSLILATSHVVTYGDKTLLNLPLPQKIYELWSIFRASGRLIWPMVYLLMFGAIAGDTMITKRLTKGAILTLCIGLQLLDINSYLLTKTEVYSAKSSFNSRLNSPEWETIAADNGLSHICFVTDVVNDDRKLLFSYGYYAANHDLTLNNFYFARSFAEEAQISTSQALTAMPEDTLFVWKQASGMEAAAYPLHFYRVDGQLLGCSRELAGLHEIAPHEICGYEYDFSNGQYYNNAEYIPGEDGEQGMLTIYPYGDIYGPYLKANAGMYEVTVEGLNLLDFDIRTYYNGGEVTVDTLDVDQTSEKVVYHFSLPEYVGDLETTFWNVGASDIFVKRMTIMPVGE